MSIRLKNSLRGYILAAASLMMAGCGVYSFTGASISPEVKTVSVQTFPNLASLIQPTFSQTFTEKLKDKFLRQTSLNLVKSNGDLNFEGAILDYRTQPAAIQAGDQAGLNRLVVSVKIVFTNKKDEKQSFESTFEQFAEYASTQTLQQEEDRLIREITDKLVDDIFNKAVVNW
jgi:hypothetical protein